MERKTEKLDEAMFSKLKDMKLRENQIIFDIGQLTLEQLNLQRYLKKLELELEGFYKKATELSNESDVVLDELNEKYPDGELNMENGTVTF